MTIIVKKPKRLSPNRMYILELLCYGCTYKDVMRIKKYNHTSLYRRVADIAKALGVSNSEIVPYALSIGLVKKDRDD